MPPTRRTETSAVASEVGSLLGQAQPEVGVAVAGSAHRWEAGRWETLLGPRRPGGGINLQNNRLHQPQLGAQGGGVAAAGGERVALAPTWLSPPCPSSLGS